MDYSNQVRDSTEETFVIFTFLVYRPSISPTTAFVHLCVFKKKSPDARDFTLYLCICVFANFNSSFCHFASFSASLRARASCLGRDRAGRSNCTESAENRCAQRRHGLERPPRISASNSHGRLRSGVDLFGRASRGHIATLKIP